MKTQSFDELFIEHWGAVYGTLLRLVRDPAEAEDLALETFPYHGTTTTCDALYMGVPVLTLAGEMHHSRVGVSLLTNVGLPELVAQSADEFVRRAVELAGAPAKLGEMRKGLRARMVASPLMNEAQFARQFEEALEAMWARRE